MEFTIFSFLYTNSSSDESANLKHLILSGDVVDGIGVYPNQENDLEIVNPKDLIKEYVRKKLNEDPELKKELARIIEGYLEAKIKEYDSND